MSSEIPICPLCHTPRMPRRKGDAWFWGCHNYPTCTAPTTTTPPVPQNLKTLLLKQQAQAVNDRILAKGCRHLLWSSLGQMARERKHVPAVWSHHQRQGRNHGNQQVHTAEIDVQRGEAPFQPEGGGTHRTGPGTGRGRRSQEVVGRGPCGGRQWRRWHRSGNCWW